MYCDNGCVSTEIYPQEVVTSVLVVEDEPLIRHCLAQALEDGGLLTTEADNAHMALQALESRSDIALVISDINMPGQLNGIDLCHAIARHFPKVKVVLTSGRGRPDPAKIPAGTLFFQKPYDFHAIVDCVRAALLSGSTI